MRIEDKNYSIISELVERTWGKEISEDERALWTLANSLEDMSCLYKIAQVFSCFLGCLCLDGWYLDHARAAFADYKVCFAETTRDALISPNLREQVNEFLASEVVNAQVFRNVKQVLIAQTMLQNLVQKFISEYGFAQRDMLKWTEDYCKVGHCAEDEKVLERHVKQWVFNHKVEEFAFSLVERGDFKDATVARALEEYFRGQKGFEVSEDGTRTSKYQFSCAAIEADIRSICESLSGEVEVPEMLEFKKPSQANDLFQAAKKVLRTEKFFETRLKHPGYFDQAKWDDYKFISKSNNLYVKSAMARFFKGEDQGFVRTITLLYPLLKLSVSEDGFTLKVEKPDSLIAVEEAMKDPLQPKVYLYSLKAEELKLEHGKDIHLLETKEVTQCLRGKAARVASWVQYMHLSQAPNSNQRLSIEIGENGNHLVLIRSTSFVEEVLD